MLNKSEELTYKYMLEKYQYETKFINVSYLVRDSFQEEWDYMYELFYNNLNTQEGKSIIGTLILI